MAKPSATPIPSGCSDACAAAAFARARPGAREAARAFVARAPARERFAAVRGAGVFLFLAIAMASLREWAETARAERRI